MTVTSIYQLPEFWTKARIPSEKVLRRLAELVRASTPHAESYFQRLEDGRLGLRIEPKLASPHADLTFTCWSHSQHFGVVELEVTANWNPSPPTTSVYTQEACAFFGPLLSRYNTSFRGSLELYQGELYLGRNALPPRSGILFEKLLSLSRQKEIAPNWPMFYQFARHCHIHRVRLQPHELRHFAKAGGFSKEVAEEIAIVYQHCRNVLAAR